MNAPLVALLQGKERERKRNTWETDVIAGMRDDYVYTSREGKVVRVERKAWPALYESVSPIV
jgi:hypothetical protein